MVKKLAIMMRFFALFLFLPLALSAGLLGNAAAHEQKLGDLLLHHAWARATPAGAKTGAVYVKIENKGQATEQLIAVNSDIAAVTEIHQMSMENDIMKMQPAGIVDIPAMSTVELKPHGLHIMLMGLKKPLAEGDTFPMTLTFAKAGKVEIVVEVGKMDDVGEHH